MRFTPALSAAALLSRSFARAQSAPDPNTLETIRVEATVEAASSAAKLPLRPHETPQSVTVSYGCRSRWHDPRAANP